MRGSLTARLQRAPLPIVLLVVSAAAVLVLAVVVVNRSRGYDQEKEDPEQRLFVNVKRAVSGQKVKLDNDQEEYLMYAGIRAPVGGEDFYDQATRRNEELVKEKKIRLRFDEEHRDDEGRLLAYVFVDDTFVNEALVREGLAYARTTSTSDRFSQRLLAAQNDARKARRGVWSKRGKSGESAYRADPKHGNFHRLSCAELPKIDPSRLVEFKSDKEALDKGFAPCAKCRP